jgi:adenosylcobinamide-GDP ribazoletransferase
MVIAAITSLVFSLFFFRLWGAMLWLVVGIFTLLFQAFFGKKIGGITGDVLGAANETNEVLALILASGMLQAGWAS